MTNLNTIPATGIDSAIANLLDGLFRRVRENDVRGCVDSKLYENCWLNRAEVFHTSNGRIIVVVEQLTKAANSDGFSVSDKLVAMSLPVKGGYCNRVTDLNGEPYDGTPEQKQRLLSLLLFLSVEDTWTKVQ